MIRAFTEYLKDARKDYLIFLLVCVFLGIGQSVDGSTLSNFLRDKLHFLILQRSALEFPRELPGFLVFLIIGFLYALGDIRIAALANFAAAAGMFLLGIIPANYTLIVLVMFFYSSGQHVYLPLANSIGMSFATDENLGKKLGRINAANTAALVLGSAALWLLFRFVHIDYTASFTIGALAFLVAAALLLLMKPIKPLNIKTRFVFRKEYRLYYWLSVLFGARKQIFLTFGPWVLVDVFKQKVTTMTILFFAISVSGIFIKPLIGHLIDRVGEKFVLGSEAGILFFVCLGYAFSSNIFPRDFAVLAICICYVIDQTLSAVSMARATYMRKIAICPEDISPTLSLGTSIDHVVSMFLPTLAGYIWYSGGVNGYKYVFAGGAVIAALNFISTRLICIAKPDSA